MIGIRGQSVSEWAWGVMGDDTAKTSFTVIDGGPGVGAAKDPAVAVDSLELVQAFIRIASADDRRRVIDLAMALAPPRP